MLRRLFILTAVVLIVALGASEVLAQTTTPWPSVKLAAKGWRGPGFYLSWPKILACWLVFLLWVRSTDWLSQDCQELRLNSLRWNPIVFGVFMGAMILVWLIPIFWVAFPLLALAYLVPFVSYVVYRNSKVTNDLRVFTWEHIRYWTAVHLNKIGVKVPIEKLDPHEKGPPVKLSARGGANEREDNARLLMARQSPGLLPARHIIYDGLSHRAAAVMLDYTPQSVGLRYMIDGVWLDREPLERESADPALEALKTLCGLKPQDRQNRQEGTFLAEYSSIKYASTLASQGTKTGERAVVQFEDKKIRFDTADELGMRSKLQDQLKELMALERGFLLFSAMPAAGLRTTADVIIRHTDRFTREFLAIEEETRRYEQIENCPVITYKAADNQTPASILPKVFRMQPEVVVVRDLVDGDTVNVLCQEISDEDRLVMSTIRAKDSVDALLRILAMGADANFFARGISAVLSQRLIRRLCEKCKEAYAPPPEVLKQLGIPEGRVQAFYRPPQQPEEVCEECTGIGYKGRTAVFELLIAKDNVRRVLATDPKRELLVQAARKDGMFSMQEEGVLLVAKGLTSLQELMRVLKQ